MDKLHELYEEQARIAHEIHKLTMETTKEKVEYNKENYVGKYYKNNNTYIKIISEFSSNEYHVTGIEFDLPVNSYMKPILCKTSYPKYNECEIDFEPIRIETYFIGNQRISKSIRDYEEITAEEYYEAMNKCFEQIKEFTNKQFIYDFDKRNYEIK